MEKALIPLFILCFLVSSSCAEISGAVGVNYGQLGNNLPTPSHSVELIKSLKAKRVKIYDANPEILKALKNTGLQVSIMVPNQLVKNISTNQTLANQWVHTNLVPFYPETLIRYLLVGNEMLSGTDNSSWFSIVPAMRKIKKALKIHGAHKVKVGTTLAMDVLQSSFPPSNGTFRSDISSSVMKPMLQFLNRTKSFLFLDVYPYFPWSSEPKTINLDYALFQSKNITITDPNTGLTYTNLFDQMVDSVIFAMKRVGYPDVRIFIAETGWPNGGDFDQIGANIYNAATYNRNVVKKFTAKPPVGTPARPGSVLPSFIFALYNENQKPGPGTERHFGLLHPHGKPVYEIDLSGETPLSEYKPLPVPENNTPYKGKIWCVAAKGANKTALGLALSYACSQGNKTCDPIQPRGYCRHPNSLIRHVSYAFSSYWAQFKKTGGSCYFDGLATQTIKDPSKPNLTYFLGPVRKMRKLKIKTNGFVMLY
ncbi:probable glucan endo-1,3-beta-glucosidase A6 isoform X1 [Cannabis sativa]|uniref:probable glucan endo-1,3-beta-glucosidase A6 isoform X1 n=1 Tax=Cannabis sativa TaxID=3483 RepID=UPI0029C9BB05|nr:probable glucan endo-1,3-beta-glucosidase A6 isoform X1 [Cannabis sativa]XP_060970634.1 probable glucan endo-1,3-beta-glucosidase A6 isoform X1 [Cannabis sativa]